jgi:hypothetical protein
MSQQNLQPGSSDLQHTHQQLHPCTVRDLHTIGFLHEQDPRSKLP